MCETNVPFNWYLNKYVHYVRDHKHLIYLTAEKSFFLYAIYKTFQSLKACIIKFECIQLVDEFILDLTLIQYALCFEKNINQLIEIKGLENT
jgi:hypothetical protein